MLDEGDAAREYHEATKHSYDSVRRIPHFLDWDNQPLPFKLYSDANPFPLPDVDAPRNTADAIGRVDLESLSRILYFTAGITKKRIYPGGEMLFRAAACTGALYHIELYVVSGPVEGLKAGVYHYEPKVSGLTRLREGDWRSVIVSASGEEPQVVEAPLTIVLTTTFWRNAWKYRARAYRHAFWDSGTMLANLLAMAASFGIPARVVVGFVDDDVNALVDVDDDKEVAVALVALGAGAGSPPAAPGPVERLGHATVPLSQAEVDYPLIRNTHRATSLSTMDDAKAWRKVDRAPTLSAAPAADLLTKHDLEQVIRRRGSSRRFARTSISKDALASILDSAAPAIDADVPALCSLYAIVHDVEALPSGAYAYDRDTRTLMPLKEGNFRAEARYLDLEQDLAGDASANVYMLAPLDEVLTRFGSRGYRAAQLEGGILGGKMYLASYGLGLGATGLTFFDDAVTEFFSPHATGKAVMFLIAIGVPAKRTVLFER